MDRLDLDAATLRLPLCASPISPSIQSSLSVRSTSRLRYADGSGNCNSPRRPRSDGRALGRKWNHHTTRPQCAGVPLRVARSHTTQAQQSLGPALRSGSGLQKMERIKTFRSNRKRCSVKPVTFGKRHRPSPSNQSNFMRWTALAAEDKNMARIRLSVPAPFRPH